jgi:cytochrome c2
MRHLVISVVVLLVCGAGAFASAQDQDVTAGRDLYRSQCSICHGLIASDGAEQRFMPPAWAPVRVAMLPSVTAGGPVAVALPYGPPLRGVYGRPAGGVPGFAYSRAFKRVLQDVVWDEQELDRWITDSQARVPGSIMFYTQPDPDIRRKIISYLQAQR